MIHRESRIDFEVLMRPKSAHLGPQYGEQFCDRGVAMSYTRRPPYPRELFPLLGGLQAPASGAILDLGCGTGDVTFGLTEWASRIDAVDFSAAMLEIARHDPRANDQRIRWICSPAETFPCSGPYSPVVAAESFHWMDWDRVMRKIAAALEDGAWLALVERGSACEAP